MNCCSKLRINGILTHEHGCTESWRDEIRQCKECCCEFHPDNRHEYLCSAECTDAYHGYPNPEDESEDDET